MSMYNQPGRCNPGQYGQPFQGQPGQYGGQPYQGQPSRYDQPFQGQPGQYGQPYQGQPGQYYCQPYTVQRGDTLGVLASQYGISVSLLATANPNASLQRGQSICIPTSGRR
ncbi:MAG TPA: hypothetical protein DDW50_03010 [Firmicutes bacterium]|jgi:hypothetical protein|nr:hypothetical protein [Bacillota bacterium]